MSGYTPSNPGQIVGSDQPGENTAPVEENQPAVGHVDAPLSGGIEIEEPSAEELTPASAEELAPAESQEQPVEAAPQAAPTLEIDAPVYNDPLIKSDDDEPAEPESTNHEYLGLPKSPDNENAQLDFQILMHEGKAVREAETIPLPADTTERMTEYLERIRPLPQVNMTEDDRIWAATMQEASEFVPMGDFFTGALKRQDSKWRQYVLSADNKPLALSRPKYKEDGVGNYVGDAAVMRMRSLLGMGATHTFPLYHTGIWITIEAPEEDKILDLMDTLESIKIRMGRASYGMAFANTSVYMHEEVVKFMHRHLHDTTLKNDSYDNMVRVIKQMDIIPILQALAAAVWPNGFQYARAVLTPDGKPKKTIVDRVDVSKLLWHDTSRLTDSQRTHMSRRASHWVTDAALSVYEAEFKNVYNTILPLNDKMSLRVRHPSLQEHFDLGQKWINGIVELTNQLFREDRGENDRNRRVVNHARASNMRQYGHWIEALVFVDGTEITDRDTLERMLATLSSNDAVRDEYFIKIREYIDSVTLSVAAVPTLEAEELEELKNRKFPNLVPIDLLHTFFTLIAQKVLRIKSRP